ncbi:MAG TPA: hypothetical protein PLD88_08865 [Candidatus Berkiella sp.]|nr:hypothetical protein [Candidatus Berkiella sp.]
MHQGPTSEEQKVITVLNFILRDLHEGRFELSTNAKDNILSIKIAAAIAGIDLNEDQIKAIHVVAALNVILKDLHKGNIELSDDFTDNALSIKIAAAKTGLSLNEKQIKFILEQQDATVDAIMKLQTKPGNPNVRLAVQISLALATAFWKPGISGTVLANIATKDILHGTLIVLWVFTKAR